MVYNKDMHMYVFVAGKLNRRPFTSEIMISWDLFLFYAYKIIE